MDQPGNPPFFFPLWNSISQGPRVVSLRAISSAALTLSSAASQLLSLPGSLLPSSRTHPFPSSLLLPQPLHLCVQGSSEACSWLRPPLLWAKDAAGGQGSGSSLKKTGRSRTRNTGGEKSNVWSSLWITPSNYPHLHTNLTIILVSIYLSFLTFSLPPCSLPLSILVYRCCLG